MTEWVDAFLAPDFAFLEASVGGQQIHRQTLRGELS